MGRSGHSGITNLNGGRKTKACDSITSCFRRICRSGSWTAVLTDGRVGKKTRATMCQHGSCLISRPESRFQSGAFCQTTPSSVRSASFPGKYHSRFPQSTFRYESQVSGMKPSAPGGQAGSWPATLRMGSLRNRNKTSSRNRSAAPRGCRALLFWEEFDCGAAFIAFTRSRNEGRPDPGRMYAQVLRPCCMCLRRGLAAVISLRKSACIYRWREMAITIAASA